MNKEFKKISTFSEGKEREQNISKETKDNQEISSERDFQRLLEHSISEVYNNQRDIIEKASRRIESINHFSNLFEEKRNNIFEQGGFKKKIEEIIGKISSLTRETIRQIRDLVSNQPEVIHFSEMINLDIAEIQNAEVGNVEMQALEQPKAEDAERASVENPKTLIEEKNRNQETQTSFPEQQNEDQQENTQAENQESKEQKELKEYLEREVFPKFKLSVEDEERALAEAPEERREILKRSFENSRKSLEVFYTKFVIDGVVDRYAVDRAEKKLNFEILAPILESSILEIKPRLNELGIDISLSSIGFTPETADIEEVMKALSKINQMIESIIRERVEKEIVESLLQKGEYRGIYAPQERWQDEEFMEQIGRQLDILKRQAINEAIGEIGFLDWMEQTRNRLNKPFIMQPFTIQESLTTTRIPEIDARKYKVYKSKEEITQLLEEEIDRAEQTGFLCINITAAKFEKVLSEGGFRDIFSLSEEDLRAMKDITGRGDRFYLDQRTVIEQALGIYNPEIPTLYGTYASENGIDEKRGGAPAYGAIFLKLKPEVQASFCEGDSMSGCNDIADEKLAREGIYIGTHWAEAAKRRQIALEHVSIIKGMNNAYRKIMNQLGHGVHPFGYIEAHIKGLKLEDIESINIPRSFAEGILIESIDAGNYESLVKRLQQDPYWKDKINIID